MQRFQVLVGNVGTVHDGNDEKEARRTYDEYVETSKAGHGRAGGEDVTLLKDGEPVAEHFGTANEDDDDD